MVLDLHGPRVRICSPIQKKVSEALESKSLVVAQSQVSASLKNLQKMFKYYRLSLYTFSLASLFEIMLSGNFKEEYIAGYKNRMKRCPLIPRPVSETALYIWRRKAV
jgi:hypothetical protein